MDREQSKKLVDELVVTQVDEAVDGEVAQSSVGARAGKKKIIMNFVTCSSH